MNDPLRVRGLERLGDFTGDPEPLCRRQPSRRKGFVERLTDDMFHDDEHAEVVVADLEHLADKRVIERGCSQRLATKPLTCRPVQALSASGLKKANEQLTVPRPEPCSQSRYRAKVERPWHSSGSRSERLILIPASMKDCFALPIGCGTIRPWRKAIDKR